MPASRVEALDASRARVYVSRGENLLATARQALEGRNADGAATAAVQSAVAFADGFTVWNLRLRSRGQDHHEVIRLIARCRTPASKDVAKLVQRALDRKNAVEYGSREVRIEEARDLVEIADTLAAQVRSLVQETG